MGRAPRITTRCTKLHPDAPNYNQGPSHHENKSLIMHCRSFQTLHIRTENPYSVPVQIPDDIGLQFGASGLTKQGWWPITFVCLTNGWGPSSLPPKKGSRPNPQDPSFCYKTCGQRPHFVVLLFFSAGGIWGAADTKHVAEIYKNDNGWDLHGSPRSHIRSE